MPVVLSDKVYDELINAAELILTDWKPLTVERLRNAVAAAKEDVSNANEYAREHNDGERSPPERDDLD